MKYTDRILHQSILAVTTQATYERIIQAAAVASLNVQSLAILEGE